LLQHLTRIYACYPKALSWAVCLVRSTSMHAPSRHAILYAMLFSSSSLFRIVDSRQPYLSASICPLLFEGRERKTHKKGKPIINPIQKNKFPTVLFRLMIGIRPTAIIGNWTIYQSATTLQRVGQLTCIKNRYGLIFLDTTAITNSWQHAERRKVTNVADVLDN
jgi:hypothetical protein